MIQKHFKQALCKIMHNLNESMRFESVYVQERQIRSDISWKAIPNWTSSQSKSTLPRFKLKEGIKRVLEDWLRVFWEWTLEVNSSKHTLMESFVCPYRNGSILLEWEALVNSLQYGNISYKVRLDSWPNPFNIYHFSQKLKLLEKCLI